jgi:Cdc6-like AAA superfamily ATPase
LCRRSDLEEWLSERGLLRVVTPPMPKIQRINALGRVFTPRAPAAGVISSRGGLTRSSTWSVPSRNPANRLCCTTSRGVGKTSLANLLSEFVAFPADESTVVTVRVNCSTQDNYKTIWSKVLPEAKVEMPEPRQ